MRSFRHSKPSWRLVDRRLVVNPGSVGMPYGRTGPHWALLRDGEVRLRHTHVDLDAVAGRIETESGYPQADQFAGDYIRSAASDAEALAVFGRRDGRRGG